MSTEEQTENNAQPAAEAQEVEQVAALSPEAPQQAQQADLEHPEVGKQVKLKGGKKLSGGPAQRTMKQPPRIAAAGSRLPGREAGAAPAATAAQGAPIAQPKLKSGKPLASGPAQRAMKQPPRVAAAGARLPGKDEYTSQIVHKPPAAPAAATASMPTPAPVAQDPVEQFAASEAAVAPAPAPASLDPVEQFAASEAAAAPAPASLDPVEQFAASEAAAAPAPASLDPVEQFAASAPSAAAAPASKLRMISAEGGGGQPAPHKPVGGGQPAPHKPVGAELPPPEGFDLPSAESRPSVTSFIDDDQDDDLPEKKSGSGFWYLMAVILIVLVAAVAYTQLT